MASTKRTVKGQRLYQLKVPQVILENALMIVEASSLEEAKAKALRNEWVDIDWEGAALVDWEVDYDSVEEC
jgi:hypothetical protein